MRDRFSTAIYCDFCGRSPGGDVRLHKAPAANVHICSECIAARVGADECSLVAQARGIMFQLTYLSTAARRAKEHKLTRLANDLFYASNRAFHELDVALARRTPEKET